MSFGQNGYHDSHRPQAEYTHTASSAMSSPPSSEAANDRPDKPEGSNGVGRRHLEGSGGGGAPPPPPQPPGHGFAATLRSSANSTYSPHNSQSSTTRRTAPEAEDDDNRPRTRPRPEEGQPRTRSRASTRSGAQTVTNDDQVTSPEYTDPGPSTRPQRQNPNDSTVLRRREANRLAAQRFRNRKKGYQDSLEERIRQLEEENAFLRQRQHMDDHMAFGAARPRSSPTVHHGRSPHSADQYPYPPFRPRMTSPSTSDADVRIASLDSANRRLQEDVRGLTEENERLRDALARWQEWGQSMSHAREQRDERDQRDHTQPPPTPREMVSSMPSLA